VTAIPVGINNGIYSVNVGNAGYVYRPAFINVQTCIYYSLPVLHFHKLSLAANKNSINAAENLLLRRKPL
jgi:hypothetical protein